MPIIKCGVCAKDFYVKPSQIKYGWGKYCSARCRGGAQFKGKNVKCFICGKEVYRSPKGLVRSKSGKYFCSKSCQTLWRNNTFKEENHANWVNGESAYRNILARSDKISICHLCGISDKRVLSAHHIDHQRTNNRIENLTWLCFNCHYLVHHYRDIDEKVRKSLSL